LPEIAFDILGHLPEKTALVYDTVIKDIVSLSVLDAAPDMHYAEIPLTGKGALLDSTEALGDETAERIRSTGAELVVGAGSGVIADLTKWAATRAAVPFILYGTAASMNAHASITASMGRQGIKTSALLDPPSAVLMDTDIIALSPRQMWLSGLGDLTAREICNADWMLSHLIRGKSFCPVPYRLTAGNAERCMAAAAEIGARSPGASAILAEACLVSAVSMTMMGGETSPSSGAEHVFSHYWDLQVEREKAVKNLHGIQVGIGTILSFALWDYMKQINVSRIDPERLLDRRPSLDSLISENKELFGQRSVLFNEAVRTKWIPDQDFVHYITGIIERWPDILQDTGRFMGNGKRTRQALTDAGFILTLEAIHRSRRQALEAILYGWRYRPRYTMIDLAWELGVLPEAAEEILQRSGLV
ncbi:MAG: iron-containing alcohol dehydrogenase, partial [Spirochaetales bacterium]|nr:iron-containing alcohol dehydrogenase [Spirochaetales bacterium]